MKIIINTINFYNNVTINHIHDNKINISGNNFDLHSHAANETDLNDFIPHIVVCDNKDHPLIAQLEERILQNELEIKELLDKRNNE
ncbi:hypothetical protein DIU31_005780 [Mucilaginibacter rubeus]|uniref:Uncharacterized protein n=1 Tax=Mucilaginibacter rubeus TaxID=2027860 RepID=A0AAE6MHD0_9SPHI|nr:MULTISPECIES: hypothetical protein [Mucilaginibacter]QEM03052.1 hypothetical protein DIU31_005780 [Mucilaginibacter rubeus]QEM15671.1 hypothetical protein DIU38_005850 [Mucilaginibacter gossypii]QTE41595.1 hypothetical protein J3L19_21955 [Mucilaginibacter rubeus]QTE48200.1 hypothetical protein J3L21_21945 [Mucilaginibacter rubeus]QTE59589.1 hypothetical protein J3L23_13585 [Mucilaginibacter rubeus]